MSAELSGNEKELIKRIDDILYYIWDPIGISNEPQTRNEYSSYVPEIFDLTKRNASEEVIAQKLNYIQTEIIGLNSNFAHCRYVSRIIADFCSLNGFILNN